MDISLDEYSLRYKFDYLEGSQEEGIIGSERHYDPRTHPFTYGDSLPYPPVSLSYLDEELDKIARIISAHRQFETVITLPALPCLSPLTSKQYAAEIIQDGSLKASQWGIYFSGKIPDHIIPHIAPVAKFSASGRDRGWTLTDTKGMNVNDMSKKGMSLIIFTSKLTFKYVKSVLNEHVKILSWFCVYRYLNVPFSATESFGSSNRDSKSFGSLMPEDPMDIETSFEVDVEAPLTIRHFCKKYKIDHVVHGSDAPELKEPATLKHNLCSMIRCPEDNILPGSDPLRRGSFGTGQGPADLRFGSHSNEIPFIILFPDGSSEKLGQGNQSDTPPAPKRYDIYSSTAPFSYCHLERGVVYTFDKNAEGKWCGKITPMVNVYT